MNWGLISSVAGIMLTIYGIKFVFRLLKSFGSKESMDAVIGDFTNTCNEQADRLKNTIHRKMEERRKKKEATQPPVIRIR